MFKTILLASQMLIFYTSCSNGDWFSTSVQELNGVLYYINYKKKYFEENVEIILNFENKTDSVLVFNHFPFFKHTYNAKVKNGKYRLKKIMIKGKTVSTQSDLIGLKPKEKTQIKIYLDDNIEFFPGETYHIRVTYLNIYNMTGKFTEYKFPQLEFATYGYIWSLLNNFRQ